MMLSEVFLIKNIFQKEKNACIDIKNCKLNEKYNDFLRKNVYDKSIIKHNNESMEAAGI